MESPSIRFEEIATDVGDLLQEIGAPGMRKNLSLPHDTAVEMRRHQISRLEENIAILRRKQEEFQRKMEDYISSLRNLINNLRRGIDAPEGRESELSRLPAGGTYVRCVGCGGEQEFPELDILFAREPEEFLSRPTEVIVHQRGKLKKGTFHCPRCGNRNLTIRPR